MAQSWPWNSQIAVKQKTKKNLCCLTFWKCITFPFKSSLNIFSSFQVNCAKKKYFLFPLFWHWQIFDISKKVYLPRASIKEKLKYWKKVGWPWQTGLGKFNICTENGFVRTFVHAKLHVHKTVTMGANFHCFIYNRLPSFFPTYFAIS